MFILDLFANKLDPLYQGTIVNQDLTYIKDYYKTVMNRIEIFRKENIWFVQGEHILNRMLLLFKDYVTLTDIGLFKYIDSKMDSVVKELELSSKYYPGKYKYNNMFTGSREAYYCYGEIRLDRVISEWRNYRPIKVVYTDNYNCDIVVPDRDKKRKITMFMEVNVMELVFQYKYWCIAQSFFGHDTSTKRFLGSYVLPNIVNSYFDCSMVNIFCKLVEDNEFKPEFINDMPFSISNYSSRMTNGLLEYVNRYKNTKSKFEKILQNVPLATNGNAMDFLRFKEFYYTKKILWFPLFSRIKIFKSLLMLIGKDGQAANLSILSSIKRDIRTILNYGNIYPDNASREEVEEFQQELLEILYMVDNTKQI